MNYCRSLRMTTDTPTLMQYLRSGKLQLKLNFSEARISYTGGQIYLYIKGGSVKIQDPVHWRVTGSSTNAPPPVLSPNSSLPPPPYH